MHALTLTTRTHDDRNLLGGIRRVLTHADEAYLCVAFASPVGVGLIKPTLGKKTSILATTVFGGETHAGLAMAQRAGASVHVLNPSGATYHPKVYVARHDDRVRAVVGSANLTGGLVKNVEAGVYMEGDMRERELAFLFEWARGLWEHDTVRAYEPPVTEDARDRLDDDVLADIRRAVDATPVFTTLGRGAENRVVECTAHGLYVETASTRSKGAGPQRIEPWMIQVALDYLEDHERLDYETLTFGENEKKGVVGGLNVKRSSFVLALLARLPGLRAVPGETAVERVR